MDNQIINNPKDILNAEYNYFANLYACNKKFKNNDIADRFFQIERPNLSATDSDMCEGLISSAECINVIKELKNNKSPGTDGLTSEFYKIFWFDIVVN